NAYSVSHHTQRRGQPVSRTNVHGSPAQVLSPWTEWKISVTRRKSVAGAFSFITESNPRRGVTFRENLGTSGEGGGDPSAPLLHPGVRPTSQPLPGWGNCGYTAGGDVRGAAGFTDRAALPRPRPCPRPGPGRVGGGGPTPSRSSPAASPATRSSR